MIESKKKKYSEPQLLFPENQAFLDGKLQNPLYSDEIRKVFAYRHHISLIHNEKRRFAWTTVGISFLLCAFFSGWLLFISMEDFLKEPVFSNLNGNDLGLIVVILVFLFMAYFGITTINYRPKKVDALYHQWLKTGKIVIGEFSHTTYERMGFSVRIHYKIFSEDGKKIRGSFNPPSINSDLTLVKGTPIYILYADKKLHAPL